MNKTRKAAKYQKSNEYFSYERKDSKGRKVVVTLRKNEGELFFIRICTYGPGDLVHKADFYKEHTPELFDKISFEEMQQKDFPHKWFIKGQKSR